MTAGTFAPIQAHTEMGRSLGERDGPRALAEARLRGQLLSGAAVTMLNGSETEENMWRAPRTRHATTCTTKRRIRAEVGAAQLVSSLPVYILIAVVRYTGCTIDEVSCIS
jgi:hypothetical protein